MNRLGEMIQDRTILRELILFLDKARPTAGFSDHPMLEIGKFFLGTPYVSGAVQADEPEQLTVNLKEFDCVTFIESVVALARHAKSRKRSYEDFRRFVREIRYRNGRLQGYSSRLHYFSDWIYDNRKKGIVRDVTAEIGGKPLKKQMNFMTTHRDLYPPLRNRSNLRRVRSVERTISKRPLFFIPKERLRVAEDRIRDGDIIAITANAEGLDVLHVGLAVRLRNRLHLLHASSKEGKVVLSPKTLYRYLMERRTRSGIMVTRIINDEEIRG